MPHIPPRVVVVVLNWNGLTDTLECLDSIRRLEYPHVEALVVDNGSDALEARQIEQCAVVSRVIRNPVNLGYTGGCNVGIRAALEMGADYVWLLNNDAVAAPDSLGTLIGVGQADARIGLLSPLVYNYDAREAVQWTGTLVDFNEEALRIYRTLDEVDTAPHGELFALAGTALLIKRGVLEKVGGFDERFFAYMEDTDYSVSAIAAGFSIALVREAAVYHKYGRSLGGRESPERDYLYTRNMYLFWSKHLTGRWRRSRYPARYIAWVLSRVVDARNRGQVVSADFILAGGWDALRGRWGSWETRSQVPRWVARGPVRWMLGWHPYLWIGLLRGDFRAVVRDVWARLLRRRH